MATKKIPMRMCISCRQMKEKRELVRIVKTVDGVKADGSINTYVLSPKVSCGIKTATLSINASGEPVITSAVFALADGSGLDIKIKSMTFSDKKPLTSFCFDVSVLDSSWLITDIR